MIRVSCGIDRTCTEPLLKDGRLGLITNHSGVTKNLRPSYEALFEKYKVTALFSPEHGIYGAAQAGAKVAGGEFEPVTGLPVYSLYGGKTAPSGDELDGVDILCFDMQDVGARFYTYLYTMTRSMREAAKHSIPFVVFDRMNPVGLTAVQGEILDIANASFVGEYAVPHRYGLTIGEFARFINSEEKIGADLHVVACDGLRRDMMFPDSDLSWVAPSPNMPTPATALVYSGTCIFEAAKNVSEGRGTTQPFEIIGAPYVDELSLEKELNGIGLPGVIFRRARFTPTFSKFAGEVCRGVQIHVTDAKTFSPFETGLYLVRALSEKYDTGFTESGCRRLFGTSRLYDGVPTEKIISDCKKANALFKAKAEKYYLY